MMIKKKTKEPKGMRLVAERKEEIPEPKKPTFDPAPVQKLIANVDDTCEYVIGLILELHQEAQNMRAKGIDPEKVGAVYKQAAQLYKYLYPIAGRCKFLTPNPQTLELLVYLEDLNGDCPKQRKGKPLFLNKFYRKIKK